MTLLFAAVIGGLLGGVGAWFAASSKAKALLDEVRANAAALQADADEKERAAASLQLELRHESEEKAKAQTALEDTRARLEEARSQFEQERKAYQDTEKALANSFDALADKALKSNNQAFIELARATFDTIQAQAKGDLETRQQAIEGIVVPLKDTLGRYEKQIQEIEKSRQLSYGSLNDQIMKLQRVTGSLDVALRTPQVRGRWGELTLRRVAELAGMSGYCDFTEQETLTAPSGRLRPDMIVNVPGGRRIAVDSKAPLQAYLDAVAASTEEERTALLKQHSAHVRSHVNQLAAKNYWEQLDANTDFVILFLPGESFFSAAVEKDPELMEFAMERRVVLAAPCNLIALLRAVSFGWRQEQAAKNAEEIGELGKVLFDRVRKFVDHFEAIGTALGKAVTNYNNAVGSLESRVLSQARKFQELGVGSGDELAVVEALENVPRVLAGGERKDL